MAEEDAFTAFMGTGWAAPGDDLPAIADIAKYTVERRKTLAKAFPDDVLVIPTGNYKVRANDTDYVFRPGTDFFWLTGCHEPDAVLIIDCAGGVATSRLYVADRSDRSTSAFYRDRRYGELWVGPRQGVREHEAALAIPCKPQTELADVLPKVPKERIRLLVGFDASVDAQFPEQIDSERAGELATTLSELRLLKDEYEIQCLRDATAATAIGFEECVRELGNSQQFDNGERWLEGTFWRRSRIDGNDVGYGSIVASGHHATTLHWMHNDGTIRAGDLLLMDMGVESTSLYTADITRTIPINGRFSDVQRLVYEAVYEAQQAAMQMVKPGAAFLDPHREAMRILNKRLADWGIPAQEYGESYEEGASIYRRYTLHGVSHMLGIDVHDCANARNEIYYDGELKAGMVLTVEPGLYFQLDDQTVPPEFRGIGVRIEDDVLVTETGYDVLSHHLPSQVDDVEAWISSVQSK